MRKRVAAATVLVSLVWLVGGTITTYYIRQMYKSHTGVLTENVATIRAGWAMQDALWRLQVLVVEAPGKEPRETQMEAAELEAIFQRQLVEAERSSFSAEERSLIQAVRGHFSVYRDHIQGRLRPPGLAGLPAPQAAEKEKTIRLARAVAEPCRRLVELNERMLADAAARTARLGGLINLCRFAFLIAGPIVGVLSGLIQTAAQQPSRPSLGQQDLQVAQREIARMESTIQGLLDFARPPALRRVPHDLRSTVRRALNLVEGRAKQQQVTIRLESPDMPVIIAGDPEQIHQVLVNLLLNGMEAMAEGGLLHIAIHAGDGDGRACRVTVCDSGPGIPPETLVRIFEPFVTDKERGTGLGLAISRRIAEEHGGALVAANREAGGAIFTLELPLNAPIATCATP